MEPTYTYGFDYNQGKVNLNFSVSLKNAADFLACLKKATEDVEALMAKADAEKK